MEALILVATSGGLTMFARIGIMRALNRRVERVFNPDRKDHHWGAKTGEGPMREDGNHVRFEAHYGLKSDIAPCPKSAISGSRTPCLHRRALGCAMVIRAARLAAISAMAGRPEQAHKAVAWLRQLNPALSVSTLKDVLGRVAAAPAREHLSQ